MIKLRVTWPLLIAMALLLFAWLIRDPKTPPPVAQEHAMRPPWPPRRDTRTGHLRRVPSAADLDQAAAQKVRTAPRGPNPYTDALDRLNMRRTTHDAA